MGVLIGMAVGSLNMMELPASLPMQDGHQSDRLFVRACFRPYYDAIMTKLDSKTHVVTVTGTPGKTLTIPCLSVHDCRIMLRRAAPYMFGIIFRHRHGGFLCVFLLAVP